MSYKTLISTTALAENLSNPNWLVVDCRFSLDDATRGQRDYEQGHIPGAIYAHLNDDLSGPILPGKTGRHPLPEPNTLAETFGRWGIDEGVQVIAYDDLNGSMAARLWWLLRWLGHERVAVLDGGWTHWQKEGRPVDQAVPQRATRVFVPNLQSDLVINAAAIANDLAQPEYLLLDARAAERYRGDVEPIDPVGGHIPGAINAPFPENLNPDGTFRPAEALQQRFATLFGDVPPDRVVCYCGSGVTAAHNLLAIHHAGLGDVKLYAGSWSEWITDPTRPIAVGDS